MGENYTGQLIGNRIGGKEQANVSVVGNMPRKGLADISNLPQPNHGLKLQAYSPNTKEYIHKLHQEIVSLTKLLADKIKIIQLHELELQKLKTICLQMRQRNQLFAQTNSQMLAELNSAKDKLKVLQHELGCKNGLLAARNLESEVEPINCDDVRKPSREDKKNNVPRKNKRKRQSKSLDNDNVKPVQVEEKIDEKRFDNVEKLPTEGVLEITNGQPQNDGKVDEKRCRSIKLTRSIREQPAAVVETNDNLDPSTVELNLDEHIVDKETKNKNRVDDNRRHSRRQSARFKAEAEEQTSMIKSNDTLNLKTSKPVQPELKIDDKRRHSRIQSTRFKVEEEVPTTITMVGSSNTLDLTISKPVQPESKTGDESLCSRRQSARCRQQEQVQEPMRDMSQIDNAEVHVSHLHELGSTPSASSAQVKFETPDRVPGGSEDAESRRTSRPKRQATEKVQSYKEIPVNIKMRRCE